MAQDAGGGSDGTLLVEFTPRAGVQKVALTPDNLAERSARALDRSMKAIREMARRVSNAVDELIDPPSQVEVSFGLKMDTEAGAIIAKTGVEGSLGVKLVWKRSTGGDG